MKLSASSIKNILLIDDDADDCLFFSQSLAAVSKKRRRTGFLYSLQMVAASSQARPTRELMAPGYVDIGK
jgi:hypothetical protein